MNIVCLDMEGVLIPEIWIAFAEATGIENMDHALTQIPYALIGAGLAIIGYLIAGFVTV